MEHPAFGQADLSNCERELIHLAGSVQPHGALMLIDGSVQTILLASANLPHWFGSSVKHPAGQAVSSFGTEFETCIRKLAAAADADNPLPFQCTLLCAGVSVAVEGAVHKHPGGGLLVECEPLDGRAGGVEAVSLSSEALMLQLGNALQDFNAAASIGVLADSAVRAIRAMTGYDRVTVYKFDPDGHGKVIAEAREQSLEPLLGHQYPASDIPQRARQLYIRNRVRVLVNVHAEASPLLPRQAPGSGEEVDMSMCYLRSMSPLHIQYLKNMGVTATLVISLVYEGRLWGLVAAHHYQPRNLRYAVRATCDLLGEVIATRVAAIENYAHTQVAIQVRRLEQRLVEATSSDGDWRLALFRNPSTLLQPLEATGAALFYEDEILTTGEAPSTPELRALRDWIATQAVTDFFACASVSKVNPALASLTPTASGVLAMRLSPSRPDFLVWFRKEQLSTVTWAGDPTKPVIGNDPLELSPRRSFALWSEIVRATAVPWSSAELALGKAIGMALVDIILQVHAVRLLVGEHQLRGIRNTLQASAEPVLMADPNGRVLLCNTPWTSLVGLGANGCDQLARVAALFTEAGAVSDMLASLPTRRQPWRGDLHLRRAAGDPHPVSLRAEAIPGMDGGLLGYVLVLTDLSDQERASQARQRLELSLAQPVRSPTGPVPAADDQVIGTILANASLAAMDIADASHGQAVAGMLEQLESSTRRATQLYAHIRAYAAKP